MPGCMDLPWGLLHADYRTSALDYQDLLSLAFMLTRDIREVG